MRDDLVGDASGIAAGAARFRRRIRPVKARTPGPEEEAPRAGLRRARFQPGVGRHLRPNRKAGEVVLGNIDDLHSTGIYSWAYLYELGVEHEKRWRAYLEGLAANGLRREPAR